jgi:hypothetical protein
MHVYTHSTCPTYVLLSPLVMAIPDGALEHSFGDEEPKVVGFLEKIR